MAKVFVITGPSGVGKGTVIEKLLAACPQVELSISATTRAPRPGEVDGREYFFISEEQFAERASAGGFLEHATFIGNSYGTPRQWISERLQAGKSVVLEIDLQGARQVRASMPEAVQIFIRPPSFGDLSSRLIGRHTDSSEQIEARLDVARGELEAAGRGEFDEVIVNDEVEHASQELIEVVDRWLQSGA